MPSKKSHLSFHRMECSSSKKAFKAQQSKRSWTIETICTHSPTEWDEFFGITFRSASLSASLSASFVLRRTLDSLLPHSNVSTTKYLSVKFNSIGLLCMPNATSKSEKVIGEIEEEKRRVYSTSSVYSVQCMCIRNWKVYNWSSKCYTAYRFWEPAENRTSRWLFELFPIKSIIANRLSNIENK